MHKILKFTFPHTHETLNMHYLIKKNNVKANMVCDIHTGDCSYHLILGNLEGFGSLILGRKKFSRHISVTVRVSWHIQVYARTPRNLP